MPLFLVLSLGAFACAGNGRETARETAGEERSPGRAGLRLEIQGRSAYALGEPVLLLARLVNGSAGTVAVPPVLNPELGFLTVYVRVHGAELARAHEPPVLRDARGLRPRPLEPGESLAAWLPLHVGREGAVFPQAGRYRVQAICSLEGGTVRSEWIEILVSAPESDEERAAADLLQSREASLYLYLRGGGALEAGRAAHERILEEHPETMAAAYARLALGLAEADGTGGAGDRTEGLPVERLRRSAMELEDPYWAVRAAVALAQALAARGEPERAREAIAAFEGARPGLGDVPGLAAHLERGVGKALRP